VSLDNVRSLVREKLKVVTYHLKHLESQLAKYSLITRSIPALPLGNQPQALTGVNEFGDKDCLQQVGNLDESGYSEMAFCLIHYTQP
jgi:hypothetical protein